MSADQSADVTLSSNGKILAILLPLFVAIEILLTPLSGIETRSPANITPMGFATAPVLFLALALNAASLFFLFRKTRLASMLAIIGSICFFPTLADQAGLLSSQPAPPVLADLELVNTVIAISIIFFAIRLRAENAPSPATRKEDSMESPTNHIQT